MGENLGDLAAPGDLAGRGHGAERRSAPCAAHPRGRDGDLHASHPKAGDGTGAHRRDTSLEDATILLDYQVHPPLKASATEGIWCLALEGDRVDSAPYFSLFDGEGRLRVWLLLPPARVMIGIGHLWLPSVPPVPGPAASPSAGSGGAG